MRRARHADDRLPRVMTAQTHTAARAQKLLRHKGALTPLILVMGFIGASLRYLLECALPANGGFPAATLAINIFGCFVLELVNQYVGRRMHLPGALVKSLGVGLVGAFTTISAFSTECLAFLQAGEVGLWAAYIVATLATTFLASLAGHAACRGLDARRLAHIERRRETIHRAHATRRAKVMREADRAKGQARNAFAQEWGKDCEGNPTVEDSSPEDEGGKR